MLREKKMNTTASDLKVVHLLGLNKEKFMIRE